MKTRFILRILAIIIPCFLLCLSAHAQYRVSGKIMDVKGVPITFATAVLQSSKDSSILQSAYTDSTGAFTIEAAEIKNTFLKAVAVGYRTQIKTFTANAGQATVDFEMHTTDKELKGVTVTASKPVIERKADRTVFNVESSVSSAGADALELLKRSPGVRVNNTDISIVGKSTVSVMVNDRLVQLSGDELAGLLKSMPAETISKIEVITAPPAKYDAAGNAGIINIVTKKQQKNGINGSATAAYEQHVAGGLHGNGNFNARYGKLNVYGNGNLFSLNRYPYEEYTAFYPEQKMVQVNDQKRRNVFGRFQAGMDYALNDKNIIGVSYVHGWGGPERFSNENIMMNAYNNTTGNLDSFVHTIAEGTNYGRRDVFNANYEWRIDTGGKKLNVDFDYFTRTGRVRRDFITDDYLADNTPTGISSSNQTFGKQVINWGSGKADMDWPTRIAKFSFGGKLSFVHNISDNVFKYLNGTDFQMDPNKTNSFDYTENTQAIYASAQKSIQKWEMQVGLRGENTQSKGYSPTLNQTVTNNYFKLFPSVFVQYNMNDKNNFNFNYTRRIYRPDFWQMNPFRSYTTNNAYEQGNPFLQPSFSTNFELGYTYKSKYTFTLFSEYVNNYCTRVSMIDTLNNMFIFTTINAGNYYSYGARANAIVNPFKWWECNLQLNAYYAKFNPTVYKQPYDNSKPTFYFETDNTISFNKNKTLLAEASFFYNTSQVADVDVQKPFWNLGLGFKALLMNKQLVLGVNSYDIFKTDRAQFTNAYNGTLQNLYFDERNIRFSITWKFGNSNVQQARERKADEDAKRAN